MSTPPSAPEKVMYDSPEAASLRTVRGWVSRLGHFYGDNEHLARWDGCTHRTCACGAETSKNHTMCQACEHKAGCECWEKLPLVEWDGESPFCLDYGGEYFFEIETFYDWCEENEVKPEEVRLVLAVPNHYQEIDADAWVDSMPEDGELPDDIQTALDALNAVIRAHTEPASWSPSWKRIIMKSQEQT